MNTNIFTISTYSLLGLMVLTSCTFDENEDATVSTGVSKSKNIQTPIEETGRVDNTLSKMISYMVPGHTISSTFSVGINSDGIISTVTVATDSRDRHDQQYHSRFNQGISSILGKNVNEIKNISAVGGASLTTEAFREVISKL